MFLAYKIILTCPQYILVKTQLACSLQAFTVGQTIRVEVDFKDGDIRYFMMKDNTLTILKTFSFIANYNITATAINTTMSVYRKINGKKIVF